MSLLEINIGGFANDGTGDDLREAFNKVNLNFQELDLRDDESTTARNIGINGEGIFAKKSNYELEFKNIVSGANILLTSTDEKITIAAESAIKSLLVITESGSHKLTEVAALTIQGGTGITTSMAGNAITVTNTFTAVEQDTAPRLGTYLDAQGYNITTVGTIDATMFEGTHKGNLQALDGTVLIHHESKVINTSINSILDVDTTTVAPVVGDGLIWNGTAWVPGEVEQPDLGIDFRTIKVTTLESLLPSFTDVDLGTILADGPVDLDLGSII